MPKKSSNFLKKEIEKFKDTYIERLTFEQLKKISEEEESYYLN